MMPKSGDKVSVKIGKRFKKHEVVSCDAEGWITFKSTEAGENDFRLHLTIHQNHIKIPEKKKVKPSPKKRGRKKKK
jgi:hypothetical protein